jgi:acetoin utilization deacetylase AcuC-like enzyme
MTKLLVESHPACLEHEAGPMHPERPERVLAALEGIGRAGLGDALVPVEARAATVDELALVHDPAYIDRLRRFCEKGGGHLDADTGAGRRSWDAALVAAGAGLDAVERIDRGEADAAFCAVRPPGHHALAGHAMGFCLFNNVAVCAAALAERGERVLIVDWDIHHGNGTQDSFYTDDRVLYVSVHQWPLYPGTGRMEELGSGAGEGLNVNFPVPRYTTGDVHLAALDALSPRINEFGPTWVLMSCGFDSHLDDPVFNAALALRAGDFGELTRRCAAFAPHRILFLEGGYDPDNIADSSAACAAALAGVDHEAPRSHGGPGMEVVEEVARLIV